MSLYSAIAPKGPTGFGYGSTAEEVTAGLSLEGKTILVTGCNSGIGLETMRVLALRGAHVLGAARSLDKAREACASVPGRTTGVACDLADPRSVRACVASVRDQRVDAIVCNAGIMALPKRETAFGVELQLFTNHIGHFLLVTELLDSLADDGRVVVVASDAHRSAPREGIRFDDLAAEKQYEPWVAYGHSKLANILFAKELARRFAGTAKRANAVHPGVIKTNLARHMGPLASLGFAVGGALVFKSIPQGAATQCFAAVHPAAAAFNGEYLSHCNVAQPRRRALDEALAAKLWEVSEQIVGQLPS